MNTLACSASIFNFYCTLIFFSFLAKESEASHIHRKQLTSALKNKLDRLLKMRVPEEGFCSDAIEELFLASKRTFQWTVLKGTMFFLV